MAREHCGVLVALVRREEKLGELPHRSGCPSVARCNLVSRGLDDEDRNLCEATQWQTKACGRPIREERCHLRSKLSTSLSSWERPWGKCSPRSQDGAVGGTRLTFRRCAASRKRNLT